jgi:hypothetical protein
VPNCSGVSWSSKVHTAVALSSLRLCWVERGEVNAESGAVRVARAGGGAANRSHVVWGNQLAAGSQI